MKGDDMTDHPSISVGDDLLARAAALGDALRARGWRLATAESCTGGLLAGACTAPAGASDWFDAGFVTYANAAKVAQLGVPAALIARHGAVSEEVARAMAQGALARAGVQLALAVTGIAGPGGGSEEKPVGLVYLHAEGPDGGSGREFSFPGDRASIRARSVVGALHLVRRLLSQSSDELV
jgi:nicotinamide-nucleotide amidase